MISHEVKRGNFVSVYLDIRAPLCPNLIQVRVQAVGSDDVLIERSWICVEIADDKAAISKAFGDLPSTHGRQGDRRYGVIDWL
ncbi:hypothetical protein DSECCO2_493580 [anaerobic digester metagenome]